MTDIGIPYEPRPLQREIHEALWVSRFAVVVSHRRVGKTVCALSMNNVHLESSL